MDLSHLGIALITFILAITLHQTNALIEDHLQNQRSNSVTFNHLSSWTKQYSADYDLNANYGLKTHTHTQKYPCW